MNAEQKYNSIISFIEDEIAKGENTQARDILLKIKSKFCVEPRSLSEVFDFLTGMPIGTYIKTRQLMKAAEVILLGGSNQNAIMYTGFSDESSFIKAFNKEFSLSPGSFAKSENPKIKKPITWDTIIDGTYETTENEVVFVIEKNNISNGYGEKEVTYENGNPAFEKTDNTVDINRRMQEIENMQILYGFDDKLSNIACKIADKYNAGIEEAFNLIDQLLKRYKNPSVITDNYNRWSTLLDEMIWFYFRLNDAALIEDIPFTNAASIYEAVKHQGVKNFTREYFEKLARSYEQTDDGFYRTYADIVGSVHYTSTDDYEDFFDLYAAYEPYNPYED